MVRRQVRIGRSSWHQTRSERGRTGNDNVALHPPIPMPPASRMSGIGHNMPVEFSNFSWKLGNCYRAVRTQPLTRTGCLWSETESLGVRRVESGVASLGDVSLFENGDERAAARACRKTLRRLAISRRNCRCLRCGARQNPTVTNFATVGFKWMGQDSNLRLSGYEVSLIGPMSIVPLPSVFSRQKITSQ